MQWLWRFRSPVGRVAGRVCSQHTRFSTHHIQHLGSCHQLCSTDAVVENSTQHSHHARFARRTKSRRTECGEYLQLVHSCALISLIENIQALIARSYCFECALPLVIVAVAQSLSRQVLCSTPVLLDAQYPDLSSQRPVAITAMIYTGLLCFCSAQRLLIKLCSLRLYHTRSLRGYTRPETLACVLTHPRG